MRKKQFKISETKEELWEQLQAERKRVDHLCEIIRRQEDGRCGNERPLRKVFCQLPKSHNGSHQAIIYWE